MAHDAPDPTRTVPAWHGVTMDPPDPMPARTMPGHDRPDPMPRRYTCPDGVVFRHAAHVTPAMLADLRRWARRVSDAAGCGAMMTVCRGYDGTPWEAHTVHVVAGDVVAATNTYDGPPVAGEPARGVVVATHTAAAVADAVEDHAWATVAACARASGAWA